MKVDGVKVKWVKRYEDDRLFADVRGLELIACPTDCGRWHAVVFLGLLFREGRYQKTKAQAQADAIRIGHELVEDVLRAVMEMAENLCVEWPR